MNRPSIGDRYRGSNSNDAATVIKVTGPNSAVIRFDSDVVFNKKHGLPPSKSDLEFDLTNFKKLS